MWRPNSKLPHLKGICKEAREGPFIGHCKDRNMIMGKNFKKGKFALDIKTKCFTVRVVRLAQFAREAVDATALAMLKVRLEKAGTTWSRYV